MQGIDPNFNIKAEIEELKNLVKQLNWLEKRHAIIEKKDIEEIQTSIFYLDCICMDYWLSKKEEI